MRSMMSMSFMNLERSLSRIKTIIKNQQMILLRFNAPNCGCMLSRIIGL